MHSFTTCRWQLMGMLRLLQADVVFLSPPWGGPGYKQRTFDVRDDVGGLGMGIRQLLEAAAAMLIPSERFLHTRELVTQLCHNVRAQCYHCPHYEPFGSPGQRHE